MGWIFQWDEAKKKIQNGRLKNSKWPPQKNLIFQLRQFSIFFHENFMGPWVSSSDNFGDPIFQKGLQN